MSTPALCKYDANITFIFEEYIESCNVFEKINRTPQLIGRKNLKNKENTS